MNEVRLNKAIAHSGYCSRRKADELILSGAVRVNGETVTEPGTRINTDSDAVSVQGAPVEVNKGPHAKRTYLLLYKPIQVVSTASDPQGRDTVLDILPERYANRRLYPVGRLDYFSEGLLLLTDDGELTNRLTHPRYHLPKEYEVRLREIPTFAMLDVMNKGMTLAEGEKLAPVKVRKHASDPRIVYLTLLQGVNRQIRRMCRDLGLTILTLRRIAIGPIRLRGEDKGSCRELSGEEVAALFKAAGL